MLVSLRHAKGIAGRTEILGYERVDVLAVVPTAIAEKSDEYGDGCKNPLTVDVLAVVHSDHGKSLQRIALDDLMMDCEYDFLEVI